MRLSAGCLYFAWSLQSVLGAESEGDNPIEWLKNSIPGEPDVDYPIQAAVQETAFSCAGLVFGGYYADPETRCQQYSVCLQDPIDPTNLYPVSFLCPNGTIFNQELFNCDWWFNVDCEASTGLYGLAEGAFGTAGGADGGSDAGQCPAASPLSDAECAGAVSTCWSPGQRDTDCPGNGLCCFDGCANTCDGEPPVVVTDVAPQPSDPVATTAGYAYDEPANPLPVRPSTTLAPAPTTPPALYGAPARSRARTGRRGRNFRRRPRKHGRRVRDRRRVVFV